MTFQLGKLHLENLYLKNVSYLKTNLHGEIKMLHNLINNGLIHLHLLQSIPYWDQDALDKIHSIFVHFLKRLPEKNQSLVHSISHSLPNWIDSYSIKPLTYCIHRLSYFKELTELNIHFSPYNSNFHNIELLIERLISKFKKEERIITINFIEHMPKRFDSISFIRFVAGEDNIEMLKNLTSIYSVMNPHTFYLHDTRIGRLTRKDLIKRFINENFDRTRYFDIN